MQAEANQYIIQSIKKEDKVVHTYWAGETGDIKNILRTQRLTEEQYRKFKLTVKGILEVTKEIDSITKEHEEKLNKNNKLNILETKITLGDVCLGGKEND